MKKWYEIKALAEADHAEILIYSEIGKSWWGDTVDAETFVKELNDLDVSTISLRINSPGGDVFEGNAIFNALKQHKATVTVYVDGLAASIASVVALAGDKVLMAPNAMFMIHNPWTFAMGDAEEMRRTAGVLDKVRGTIVGTYERKTGKTSDELIEAMDAVTWLDAEEAIAWGFADAIVDDAADEADDVAALANFDLRALARYKNVPTERIAALVRPQTTADPAASAADVPSLEDRVAALEANAAAAVVALAGDESRDTDGKVDPEKVAQVLRARFE